ncbi:hypothetical protein OPT61_g1975 [Boeremia exigua]|uniref:Uncharacterized protein n=1 Tax=Boeremia exigua TaxID=749465 RepID=A0ACC2INE0_9PLEO|nr:hypothetical protein OPT61_g1975 [Boeremia exigua]
MECCETLVHEVCKEARISAVENAQPAFECRVCVAREKAAWAAERKKEEAMQLQWQADKAKREMMRRRVCELRKRLEEETMGGSERTGSSQTKRGDWREDLEDFEGKDRDTGMDEDWNKN